MIDLIGRLLWFGIVSAAFSYVFFLTMGNFVHQKAAGTYDPVLVRDELSPGSHHLAGMIMVPSPCDELSMHTEQISTTTYALLFKTWREPTVTCNDEEVPRSFREVVFAPALGVRFIASLNGSAFPVAVLPVTPDR